ncbi:MAG TPA: hypothetical protein VKE24_17210, partial [Candidatus Acidoferrales bacterium]|nr:hypothetical protein [Candidatus Acidoferrales bacterium]
MRFEDARGKSQLFVRLVCLGFLPVLGAAQGKPGGARAEQISVIRAGNLLDSQSGQPRKNQV